MADKNWNNYISDFDKENFTDNNQLYNLLMSLIKRCKDELINQIKSLERSYVQYIKSFIPSKILPQKIAPEQREDKIKKLRDDITYLEGLAEEMYNLIVTDEKKSEILKVSNLLKNSDYFEWRNEEIPVYQKDYKSNILSYRTILDRLENRSRDLLDALNEILDSELKELNTYKYQKEERKDFLISLKKMLDKLNIVVLDNNVLKKELDKIEKEYSKKSSLKEVIPLREELKDTMLEGLAFRHNRKKLKSRRLPTRK